VFRKKRENGKGKADNMGKKRLERVQKED